MAYALSQQEGIITNVESGGTLEQLLVTACRMVSATLSVSSDSEDASPLGAGSTTMQQGLYNYTVEVECRYPTAAPVYGNTALITFSSGYVPFVRGYTLNFDFGENETTALNATAPVCRSYRPNYRAVVTGTFSTQVDNVTMPSLPTAANTAAATATFKLCEGGATDPNFSGDIRTTSMRGPTIGPAGQQLVEYDFQFSGSVVGTSGTTATPIPLSGSIGRPSVGETFQFLPEGTIGQTCEGYLRSLSIVVEPGSPIRVTATIRGTAPFIAVT